MEKISKIKNVLEENRFEDCPRIGDTYTSLSLKFLTAVDDHQQKISLPFKKYSETFGQILKRFLINSQPIQPMNTQYAIEFTKTGELISEGKKLELYKEEIEDIEFIYFKVYPIETHQMNVKSKKIDKLLKESVIADPALNSPANIIRVSIRKPNNQIVDIAINRLSPLRTLKLETCKLENLDYNEFYLLYVGKKLDEDERTLDDYGIEDESVILLILMANLGCFSPLSLIHVNLKQTKKVEEIKRGQKVLSFNLASRTFEEDQVISIHRTRLGKFLRVILEDGTEIQCTSNHKFLTPKGTWQSFEYRPNTQRLQRGSMIMTSTLNQLEIKQIIHMNLQSPVQFMHISTKHNHNFILNNTLSHNMQIKILNTQTGTEFTINIVESDTVDLLKMKIEETAKIGRHQFILVLNKKELQNSQSISDYLHDIKNCNYLEMIIHEAHTIVINRIKIKREFRFQFDKDLTVRDLKTQIEKALDISRDQQILILNNIEMLNNQRIGEFELHKNFNRINLIEIEEEQLTQSKMRFEQSKILIVRPSQNEQMRLNYFSLKQMKVEQFILSFIPNSKRCYSLHFGEFILGPWHYLKEIENYPIINNEEMNCYVVRSFDKLSFFGCLDLSQSYNEGIIPLLPNEVNAYQSRQAEITAKIEEKDYKYAVKAKFNEQVLQFCKPILHYTNSKVYHRLSSFLQRFFLVQAAQTKLMPEFNFCSSLVKSLQLIPSFVGQTYRLIKDTRFREIYDKRGETLYFQSFLSTHGNPGSIDRNGHKNYTFLHIKSLTGKEIGLITGSQDQIIFSPFTYFFIQKIINQADYDEVWLIEVPTPLSFTKDVFMWVDDEPNSQENRGISNLIDLSRFELVQLVSTEIAEYWMREFGWILKWKGKKIKVMSDMKRIEGVNDVMVDEAGINLVESFHHNFGYTTPIFIYCKNTHAARKALQNRQINKQRIQKITNDEFQLLNYMASP